MEIAIGFYNIVDVRHRRFYCSLAVSATFRVVLTKISYLCGIAVQWNGGLFKVGAVFASKGYPFKIIFDFTTAGDWDCVAAVERLPALHYSVDFIFLSFGIMGFIVEL